MFELNVGLLSWVFVQPLVTVLFAALLSVEQGTWVLLVVTGGGMRVVVLEGWAVGFMDVHFFMFWLQGCDDFAVVHELTDF